MTEATVNANISHCLRTINHLGSSEVVNICDGTHVVIPWGAVDWMICASISAVVVLFITVFLGFVIMMTRDFI